MAINIRYDDAGAVGSLAQQAGEGQAFGRRFAMGQQLVESARAWQNQQDQLRLQSMQLQNAMRISRTPTGQASQRQSGPFQQSVQQAKSQSQLPSAFTQNLSEGEQHALAIGIKMGDRDMVRQLIQKSLAGQGQGTGTIIGTDVAGQQLGARVGPEGEEFMQRYVDPSTGEMVTAPVRREDMPFSAVTAGQPQPSNLDFSTTQQQLTPGQAAVQERFEVRQQQRAAEQQLEQALDPIDRDIKRLEKSLTEQSIEPSAVRAYVDVPGVDASDIRIAGNPAAEAAARAYFQAVKKRQELIAQQPQAAPAAPAGGGGGWSIERVQ